MDIDRPVASSSRPARTPLATPSANDLDFLDEAGDLESRFYQAGYDAGHAHGQLHGLFEGRQLGQEKAWEVWEEVGFYEGFAGFWARVYGRQRSAGTDRGGARAAGGVARKEAKALAHAQTLLALIADFPTLNPSSAAAAPASAATAVAAPLPGEPEGADMALLLSNIRARYRLLCTSLGVRPRLVAAHDGRAPVAAADGGDGPSGGGGDVVEGIEGPMKGVDTRLLRF